ncbi:probable carboxylesterase 16 [Zingiber officinale]|uniref:probable carboxylesterase 16 n=1 Tax=Zingiber officinale TaxID=94328 RepID=UPI001C4AD6BF|nr:probable carboxylesterase 16 [Zingiber officinale]
MILPLAHTKLRPSQWGSQACPTFPCLVQSYCSSKCVLLGVSCGTNIADFVARKAVEEGKLIEPVKVVAQVLMCLFFAGTVPTHSELKLTG